MYARQRLHIEPTKGWLNDPNGLCCFNGKYHAYFQFCPDSAKGQGKKCWGHCESSDMVSWSYTGIVIKPDTIYDADGAYSGCAVVDNNVLHIFYTGNVKLAGNHDYITSGRLSNTIHVQSTDGIHFSEKKVVLNSDSYPDFCSCHVRDPKVRIEDGKWQMVLGARSRDDKGLVLFYESDDGNNWKYSSYLSTSYPFGYMWECPDVFTVRNSRFLSLCPQGLCHEDLRFQNVYQSGYFPYEAGTLDDFTEWDMGFDFYAPQTFKANDGRTILCGWMGLPDIAYTNPTVNQGYQHCLTLFRELSLDKDGKILQKPVRELNDRHDRENYKSSGHIENAEFPFILSGKTNKSFSIDLTNGPSMLYDNDKGFFTLSFVGKEQGFGRTVRKALVGKCENITIVADCTSLEIFLSDGKTVFSTRNYPDGNFTDIISSLTDLTYIPVK